MAWPGPRLSFYYSRFPRLHFTLSNRTIAARALDYPSTLRAWLRCESSADIPRTNGTCLHLEFQAISFEKSGMH